MTLVCDTKVAGTEHLAKIPFLHWTYSTVIVCPSIQISISVGLVNKMLFNTPALKIVSITCFQNTLLQAFEPQHIPICKRSFILQHILVRMDPVKLHTLHLLFQYHPCILVTNVRSIFDAGRHQIVSHPRSFLYIIRKLIFVTSVWSSSDADRHQKFSLSRGLLYIIWKWSYLCTSPF